jgi:hypothetical protein
MSQKVPLLDSKPVEGENSEKKHQLFELKTVGPGLTFFGTGSTWFNHLQGVEV